VFDKLDAVLAHGVMSVGAVKGVEIGDGFAACRAVGSMNNDPLVPGGFAANHAGGILGGISSGQDIVVRAAVKPIASVSVPQQTITRRGEPTSIVVGGRHDVSAIPRIVPVIRAMVALVLADALLLQARMAVLP
jgi:chorismate synthase